MKAFLATLVLGLSSSVFAAAKVEAPKTYVFKVDFRPVDGALHEIAILPEQGGTYSAKKIVTTSGFGLPVEITEKALGDNLVCVETIDNDVLSKLSCSVDNRPVDGLLTEVVANINESGKYEVSLRTAYYDRIKGQAVDETAEIGRNLELAQAPVVSAPKAYLFEIDARPVDGNLLQVSLKTANNGSFNATQIVTTAGFGFPVTTTKTKLATDLECVETLNGQVLEILTCAIDMRPADGFLIEVIATRNEAGRYDINLHKSAYSMIDGSVFDETTLIGSNLHRVK